MTPRRVGILAGLATAIGFFAVASVLDVMPGRPMASRNDVYFQSDAGGIVNDAVINYTERARGVHLFLYPLWTFPLHHLATALEPSVPANVTATFVSRVLVNLCGGLGIGFLVSVLRRRGCSAATLGLFVALLVTSPGNSIAAIPDHFGISLGVLAASFGVFLRPGSAYPRAAALLGFTLLAGAVTITNVVFPLMLLIVLAVRELPRRVWIGSVGVAVAVAVAGLTVYLTNPALQARVEERVHLYINWKLTGEPLTAATMAIRGIIDSGAGSTPVIATNNFEAVPMLTHQAPGRSYRVWPYDNRQTVAAVAWLMILFRGIVRGWRTHRTAVAVLLAWCLWNALFHTVWGDEYFLYTPHYAWAFLTAALLGWKSLSPQWLAALALPMIAVNVHTLFVCREIVLTIPV